MAAVNALQADPSYLLSDVSEVRATNPRLLLSLGQQLASGRTGCGPTPLPTTKIGSLVLTSAEGGSVTVLVPSSQDPASTSGERWVLGPLMQHRLHGHWAIILGLLFRSAVLPRPRCAHQH